MALTFITMCRIAGVPARWQSGLYVAPDSVGSHDWAEFYTRDENGEGAVPETAAPEPVSYTHLHLENRILRGWTHQLCRIRADIEPFEMV